MGWLTATKKRQPSASKKSEAIDLNVFDDGAVVAAPVVESKDEASDGVPSPVWEGEVKEEEKDSPLTPASVVDPEATRRRATRETRYRSEMNELRDSIVTQRQMWEALVKDSEAQLAELRHKVAAVAKERDALRHDVDTEKLRSDGKHKELTDELVRVKMRAAELSAETEMLCHHTQLVARRRDAALTKKKTRVFHTCVEDDSLPDYDA